MEVLENVPLSGYTTFGIGGPARFFVEARSEEDVGEALDLASRFRLPLFVLGGGSNLLVSDRGFPGVVLKIALSGIHLSPVRTATLFRAGAGENWDGFVARCVEEGFGGIECLSGIPGSVGGTPVQNVGAYGQEVASVIDRVRAVDRATGRTVEFDRQGCGFSYRASRFNTVDRDGFIILSVDYRLEHGLEPNLGYQDVARLFAAQAGPPTLAGVREAVKEIRRGKGMLIVPGDPDSRSAGSFFKNPIVAETDAAAIERLTGSEVPRFPAPEGRVKLPAAWLIEKAGFTKGMSRGGAAISSRHTLALTNRKNATAADVVDLARQIRDAVRSRFGIELRPEPVLLGFDGEF